MDIVLCEQLRQRHTVVLACQKNKPGNRQWYRGKPECKIPKAGYHCDEYPFFKTKEGGALGYRVGMVSIRQVPARENLSVGGHFGFLSKSMQKTKADKDFVVVTSDSLPTTALPLGRRK